MQLSQILDREWVPALGCTEPASVACAAANASNLIDGAVVSVHLVCDVRLYKNCYAVGIPHSGKRSGILWTLAIGACLPDATAGLQCFAGITPDVLAAAGALIDARAVTVEVDTTKRELYADCRVVRTGGRSRAVIAGDHTNLARLERDGVPIDLPHAARSSTNAPVGHELSRLTLEELVAIAADATPGDRARLIAGAERNLAIARHGLTLLPESFRTLIGLDQMTRISRLVCAGVYARMSGEDFVVMSLAGSGNKGITATVPILLWGRESGFSEERIARALAVSCLVTAATTPRLGRLSAVCGVSNAAGIGVAVALVDLQDGDAQARNRAVNNLVGNVAGMICDGAKIGCGLKAMTAVDAAFRSTSLALAGVGIPYSDGIVGADAGQSFDHLERIAGPGMQAMDDEILRIMQEKLRGACSPASAPQ
ncbi:MAG: L-serine ammonia-lyase, iron-sulfur-dependent, subunit alpha [Planctomycetes bacterium]|nr:L-serine ammonia-lyase, iron-sulfur-dependent, subunit alpha [Planctomycetota bacterium]